MDRYYCKIILFIGLYVGLLNHTYGQQQAYLPVMEHYQQVREKAPREKLYLQFDKSIYAVGDTIWFKAYLVEAYFNTYSPISGVIYVELVKPDGEVLQTIALPTNLGLTWAGVALKEQLYPPGNYTFRAYTNWMQNFGDTYIFKKDIRILDINSEMSASSQLSINTTKSRQNRATSTEKLASDDIQFLPEGGTWLAGKTQKMAFKALDANGNGIAIQGEVLNSKQQQVTQFKSNSKGMGYLMLSPELGENYTALLHSTNGTQNVTLPKAIQYGTSLALEQAFDADSIKITVNAELVENQELSITGISRGLVCFVTKMKSNSKSKTFMVPKEIFPTGVGQIVLQNEKNQTLNERNFYVQLHNALNIKLETITPSYSLRDSIALHMMVTDASGKPVAGSFSMAVTDDEQVLKDSVNDPNILSYFLMSSDLKGEIESPGYYFHQPNAQTHQDLDALMLTQGWVSYNWDLTKKPVFRAEKEYAFTGKVTNILNKPAAKSKLILLGTNKSTLFMDTIANDNGEFTFDKLPLLDSAYFVIQALNAKGKKGTLGIELNEFRRPPFLVKPQAKFFEQTSKADSSTLRFIETQKQAYQSYDGIALKAVNIIGKKIIPKSKNLNGPGVADLTLGETELNPVAKETLLTVLEKKVDGFRTIAGKDLSFAVGFTVFKLIIDGIDVDFAYSPTEDSKVPSEHYYFIKNYLDYYKAEDIAGIEVMSSKRNGSNYRFRFINPLDEADYTFVEVTTKTGSGPFLKKASNMYLLRPLTYGDTKLFYSPRYTNTTKTDKSPDLRSTIFWQPNILSNDQGKAEVSFFSADRKGSYTVWVEGTDLQGNFGMKTMKIKIN